MTLPRKRVIDKTSYVSSKNRAVLSSTLRTGLMNIQSMQKKLSYNDESLLDFSTNASCLTETWSLESHSDIVMAELLSSYSMIQTP